MLIISVFVFVLSFVAITYGVELLMPPFGKLYYSNIEKIIISLGKTVEYKLPILQGNGVIFVVILLGVIPFFLAIKFNRKLNKKLKKNRMKIKYYK